MRTNNTLVLFLLLCQITYGQIAGEKLIHGKIVVESGNVEGITIINLVNEKSTASNSKGDFYILAKAEDLLVFSSINLEYHRKIIEEEDLKSDILIVKMMSKVIELEEVTINKHPEINAVALGISPKGIIQRTRGERRLYSANSTPITALINAISGRTAMLKKELEVEKKVRLLVVFGSLFDYKYFTHTLKIPSDYIKGFQYYCIEDKNLAEALKSKNIAKINFLIVPLALKYNEIISGQQ
ncbi:MAG: hypothetical protein GZ087_00530 [Flavobacterium sp.]|nr:hypothetical protein [Flavobacterium sp.]